MIEPKQNVAVYCGASNGTNPVYVKTADTLAKQIVSLGFGLVYGGGDAGLMGTVAKSAIRAGGFVSGIITKYLQKREGICIGLSRLEIVETMHERKQRMFDLSQAFIILPGGTGTLDELFEILVWRQIRLHSKPIILFNINNYWTPLLHYLSFLAQEGFMDVRQLDCLQITDTLEGLELLLNEIALG